MNDIRGAVLSASLGIENELVLLVLADQFGTNDSGRVRDEYFGRQQGLREDHSLGRKIHRVKSIIRKCRTMGVADEILQRNALTPETPEVAPDFGTSGLVGRSLLRMRQDGAEDDEDETED